MLATYVDAAVARLLEARKGGEPVPADFIAEHPLSLSDALTVQARVQAEMGPVGGWKVAPSSTQEKPNFAPVFSRDVHGATARFARGAFRKTGIECEIAYRIGRDLMSPPYSREQVADAIDSLVPLIEICDTRLADQKAAPPGWRLADNGGNGAILVGQPVKEWRDINTQQQPVILTFDGKTIADKPGNPNPDLVAIVQLLVNQAGMHCGGIRTGHIVTTGSMSGNIAATPGTEIVASFRDLGELRITLDN